jgi:hypothetical protein
VQAGWRKVDRENLRASPNHDKGEKRRRNTHVMAGPP